MPRRSFGRALIVLCALLGAAFGSLFHSAPLPAQGPSPSDAPPGTVIYTAAASCPVGWADASGLAGRLVVGTDVAADVGDGVGTAMLPDEAPTHRHDVTLGITIGTKRLQDWCCAIAGQQDIGVAGDYTSVGQTSLSHSGAPILQLRACRKP
jgi:hypothetical protein